MMYRSILWSCLCMLATVSLSMADDIDPKKADMEASLRMSYLKYLMSGIDIQSQSDKELSDLEINFEPLLRYNHPERGILESCVFRLGTEGRPRAIVTAELYGTKGQRRVLLNHEFVAISDPDLSLTRKEFVWEPPANSVNFTQLKNAPSPKKDQLDRAAQMEELVDKFHFTETWQGKQSKLEKFAGEIHRYKPSDEPGSEGVIFAFGLGRNPEVLLFLETDGTNWIYGCAPLGGAEISATIDDTVVWTFPGGNKQPSFLRADQNPLLAAPYAWLHIREELPILVGEKLP